MIIDMVVNLNINYTFQRWGILLGLFVACCGNACGQGSFPLLRGVDASASYSYIRGNSAGFTYGFHVNGGTAALTLQLNNRLAVVGDFGVYRFGNLPSGVRSTMYTYLAGPRVSLHKFHRLSPFVQVLAGGGRLNATSAGVQAGENGLVVAAGGGLDAPLGTHFSMRLVQAEYLLTRFERLTGSVGSQNDVRLSAGLVFHLAGRQSF